MRIPLLNCVPTLLASILLSIEPGIPPEVREVFVATGTSHVIALSGFNITLVSELTSLAFAAVWSAAHEYGSGEDAGGIAEAFG